MKKNSMKKRLAACILILCMILTAIPVQAATTSKADSALKTAVNKVVKTCKITSSTSKTTALKKVCDYVSKGTYGRAPLGFKPDTQKNWGIDFAKQLLNDKKRQGSCYHYAAASAFLAKKVSKYPVRIGYGRAKIYSDNWQNHAWIEVKIGKTWYIYDANANQFAKKRVGKWYKQKRTSMAKIYDLKTAKYINVEI